jgi:hypothetical protein
MEPTEHFDHDQTGISKFVAQTIIQEDIEENRACVENTNSRD